VFGIPALFSFDNRLPKLNDSFHYDLRKHYVSAHIVNIWNSLTNTVVNASTVNTFKARLDTSSGSTK